MAAELGFVPAGADDAGWWADFLSEQWPDQPVDPDSLAHEWEFDDRDLVARRWNLELDGVRIGAAQLEHARRERTSQRYVQVSARVRPGVGMELAGGALERLEADARAEGGLIAQASARAYEEELIALLRRRGFKEDRVGRIWELDLRRHGPRLLELASRSRDRMREQGVELLTLDRWDDPDRFRKLYELDMRATADIPSTETFVPHEFDDWRLWFAKPDLHPDRFWLARQGGDLLGLSLLLYPRRGAVNTDFTGVSPAARGRGIARALKLETLAQAIALAVPSVWTENDGENAPILHLNEELGYEERPGWIAFTKPL